MQYKIKIIHELSQSNLDDSSFEITNPFSKISFFKILEHSRVIGDNTGWTPLYFCAYKNGVCVGILYSFIKHHSYGEYIFDWAWADFYQRNNIPYYPKLISAIPFSPINAPKFVFHKDVDQSEIKNIKDEIISELQRFIKKQRIISGHHYLFADDSLNENFKNYIERVTLQYHFQNSYHSFDDFLSKLKARKRKNISKERKEVSQYPVEIRKIENDFSPSLAQEVYELYLTTIDKKYSHAYLNLNFFKELFQNYADHILVFGAYEQDKLIAMSLFFKSKDVLYGRYWGIDAQSDYRYLHFEMCYYLGIEYCIENNISLFEAGAQGEQKLIRGFRPVEIKSFHKLSIDQIHQIVHEHIEHETKSYRAEIVRLNDYLPYK